MFKNQEGAKINLILIAGILAIIASILIAVVLVNINETSSSKAFLGSARAIADEITGETDEVNYFNFELTNVDAGTGEVLPNAEIELTYIDQAGQQATEKYTADESGKVVLENLSDEVTYTITETKAPSGYIADSEEKQFIMHCVDGKFQIDIQNGNFYDLTTNENILTAKILNTPSLKIKKQDPEGAPIEGVKFTITDELGQEVTDGFGNQVGEIEDINGEQLRVVTTNENGEITENLLPGKYILTEVQTPSKYELPEDENARKQEIEITQEINNQIIIEQKDVIPIKNYRYLQEIINGINLDSSKSTDITKDGKNVFVSGILSDGTISGEYTLNGEEINLQLTGTETGMGMVVNKEGKVENLVLIKTDEDSWSVATNILATDNDEYVIIGSYNGTIRIPAEDTINNEELTISSNGKDGQFILKFNNEGKIETLKDVSYLGMNRYTYFNVKLKELSNNIVLTYNYYGEDITIPAEATEQRTPITVKSKDEYIIVKFDTDLNIVDAVSSMYIYVKFSEGSKEPLTTGETLVGGNNNISDGNLVFNEDETTSGQKIELDNYNDGVLAKYDENGKVEWAKKLGTDSGSAGYYKVIEVSDGYVGIAYLQGNLIIPKEETQSGEEIRIENQNNENKTILIKYTTDGKVKWAVEPSLGLHLHVDSILKEIPNGYIVSGTDKEKFAYENNLYVMTYDESQSQTTTQEQKVVTIENKIGKGTVIVHHYKENTTESLSADQTITGEIGTYYETAPAMDIPAGYSLVGMPENATGEYAPGTIEVTYYYRMPEAIIEDSNIAKESTLSKITEKDQEIPYNITYATDVDLYMGDVEITLVDTLPYEIDEAKSSLDGGIYDAENKTITWKETIIGIDTYTGGKKQINIEKSISVVFKDIDGSKKVLTNKIAGTIKLTTQEKSNVVEATKDIPQELPKEIKVTKIWDDNNNRANKRPSSVTMVLTGNEQTYKQELTKANAVPDNTEEDSNTWEYTFTNLPRFDENGEEIDYVLSEEVNDEENNKNYTSSVEQDTKTITNTFVHSTEKVSIPVTKVWDDNNNALEKRPASVTMVLTGNNQVYKQTLTKENADQLNANNWVYTFEVPKYDENNDEINYVLSEELDSVYYTSENSNVDQESKTVTNKFAIPTDTIALPITIVWDDDGDMAAKRPETADIFLNGSDGSGPYNQTLTYYNEDEEDYNKWVYTFKDLPKYNQVNGDEIVYTLTQGKLESEFYTSSVNNEEKTITNKFVIPDEKISITAKKEWNDNNNYAGKRPESVTLLVIGKGMGVDFTKEQTITSENAMEGDSSTWECTFTDLPKYDDYGDDVKYTIDEKSSGNDFYVKTNVNQQTRTITNTYQIPDIKVDIPVTKIWDDDNNSAGKRPESIILQIKDGENAAMEHTVTAADAVDGDTNRWQYVFSARKYDGSGNEIHYTVDERDLNSKYYEKGEVNQEDRTITNKYIKPDGKVTVHYYIQEQDGTETIMQVPNTEGKGTEDVVIEGKVGTSYTTKPAENVQQNYELIATPTNANGVITEEPTVVTYYYKLKDPIIENSSITKNSTLDKVTEEDQAVPYSITYTASVDTYIGDGEVTIVDTLPYQIDEEKSNLDGGSYDANSKTITWKEDIAGINTFANDKKQVNVTKEISVVYKDLDVTKANVTNKVAGTINLETPEKSDTVETTNDIPTEFLKDVKVTKVWDDNNNVANKRPSAVTMVLTGNGETHKQLLTVENALEENSNTWEYTFKNLKKYDAQGTEIDYQVSEETSAEENNKFYVASVEQSTKTVTNTFTVTDEKVSVTAKKYWDDNNNHAGKRPDSATLTVTGTGEGVEITKEQEVTLDNAVEGDQNTWECTFGELPKYDNNGDEVVYTVNEKDLDSEFYIKSNVDQDTKTVTNKFQVPGEKVNVQVTKVWDDNNNSAHKRPKAVTLQVKNGDEVVAEETYTGKNVIDGDINRWQYVFSVPKYDENGNAINYTVDEADTGSVLYTKENTEISGDMNSGYIVTNKFVVPDETISVPINIVWNDNGDIASKRPKSVDVVLSGNDGSNPHRETLTNSNEDYDDYNKWEYTFTNLPKYNQENGDEIVYTLSQENLNSIFYTSSVDDTNKTITNTFSVPDEKISLTARKEWNDNNNYAGKRPESITLTVTGKGIGVDFTKEQTITSENAMEENSSTWEYTFSDLQKYDEYGDEVQYTIDEKDTGNQFYVKTNVNQQTKTITNTFQVPDVKINIPVTKVWDDDNNSAGKRPESVILQVKDGENPAREQTVTEADAVDGDTNRWQYVFNVRKYDSLGNEINYTVDERDVNSKYYVKEEVNQADKTITNKFVIPDGQVIVHYYIQEEDGTKTTIQVPNTEGTGTEDAVITDKVGTSYVTKPAENVQANYEVAEIPANAEGTIQEDPIEVTYYYKLKQPTIENSSIAKNSTLAKVTDKDQKIPYNITYTANVDTYIGDSEVTIVDTLPYDIEQSSSVLDGGSYNAEAKTITWREDVTGINTFADGKKQVNITKNITLVYKDLDVTKANVSNKVTGTINLKTPEKTDITEATKDIPTEFLKDVKVTKVWNDNNNIAKKRPTSVTMVLTGNGETHKQSLTTENATEDENTWEYTFANLQQYDAQGAEIDYQVSEEVSSEENNKFYVASVEQSTKKITNTFTVPDEKVSVTAKKYWDDNSNHANKRPTSATLTVTGTGEGVDITKEQEVTSNNAVQGDSNTWECTFTELPKYDNYGDEIVYTVNEKDLDSEFYIKSNVNQETRTVTNTFQVPGDKVSVQVAKVWDDNSNKAKKRPKAVTIQVKNGDEIVAEDTFTGKNVIDGDTNKWQYVFVVPKYDENGDAINYTVDEADTESIFYTKANTQISGDMNSGYIITNKFVVPDERISVPVTKVWDDNNNSARKRPSTVTMVLTGNGQTFKQELNETNAVKDDTSNSNTWKYTFTNLPKYDENGDEIVYTLSEELDNIYYTAENSKVEQETKTITNTFAVPDVRISIPVVKIWNDNNNIANKRPDNVVLVLTGNDGSEPHKTTLSGHNADQSDGNRWNYTFIDLPKYNSVNGDEIVYTLSEELDNIYYTATNSKVDQESKTVTNTFKVPTDTINVPVVTVWNDNGDIAKKRPTSVDLVLTGNDGASSYRETLTSDNNVDISDQNKWLYTFTGLPKYNAINGDEIVYSLSEENVNSIFYVTNVNQEAKTVTNTFSVPDEKTSVTAKKVWDDNNNHAGKRPDSATLTIVGTGEGVNISKEQNVTSANAVSGDANTWEYTFGELPEYDNYGNEVNYTVNEKEIDNQFYIKSDVDQATRTITNTFKVPGDKVDVTVTKVWDDNENSASKRPGSVTLQVKDGNEVVASEAVTKTDAVGGDTSRWSSTFSVPKYDENGNEINYTADEADTESKFYTAENKVIEGDMKSGYTITNKFVVPDERISIPVAKVWDDNNNSAGKRPESVTLVLTGNGQTYKQELTEANATEDTNRWEDTFNNLPKLDSNGDEINYVLSEELDNIYYTNTNSKVDQEYKTVTNTFKVPTDTVDIPVTKVWNDNNNTPNKRPASVNLVLTGDDGSDTHNPYTHTLTVDNVDPKDSNRWLYTFTGLPKYNQVNGDEIVYTLSEEDLDNKFYTASYDQASKTVTNTFTVLDERTSVTVTKIWDDDNNSAGKRSENVTLKVLGNGQEYTQMVTSANAVDGNANNWEYTFNNLPKYDNNGYEIAYTVDEADLNNKFYEKGNADQSAKTVTNVSKYGRIIVHHYIMSSDGSLTNTKVPSTDGAEVQDEIIEGARGENYATNPSENIQQNYELAQTPANASGQFIKGDIEVNYYYKLKTPSVTNQTISKTGTDRITSADQEVDYAINYTASIADYIGNAEVTMVDTLPYEIDTNKSDLNGGSYDANSRTITWKEQVSNLNSYSGNGYANVTKNIKLVYIGLDMNQEKVRNVVKGNIKLLTPEKTSEEVTGSQEATIYKSIVSSEMLVDKTEVAEGERVQYTLRINNDGNLEDTVVVKDTLPEGMTFDTNTQVEVGRIRTTYSEQELANGIDVNVPANGTVEVIFAGIVNTLPNGQYTKELKNSATTNDKPTNEVTTTVTKANITAHKEAEPTSGSYVRAGDTITYRINLRNEGRRDGTVIVKDTIPNGTTFVAGSIKIGAQSYPEMTADNLSQGINITVGTGVEGAIEFKVTVNRLADGTKIKNTAFLEKNGQNEKVPEEPEHTYIEPKTEQHISKTGTTKIDSLDQEITYNISYNAEIRDYEGNAKVKLVDTLPFAIDTTKSDLNGGIYDETAKTITWEEPVDNVQMSDTKEVTVSKQIKVVYKGIGQETLAIQNVVAGHVEYETPKISSDEVTANWTTTTGFTVNIPVSKVWEDDSNKLNQRPTKITFKLTGSDGSEYTKELAKPGTSGYKTTQDSSNQNKWNDIFTDLPKYDANGKEIEYKLTELKADMKYYDASVDSLGTTVTNTNKYGKVTVHYYIMQTDGTLTTSRVPGVDGAEVPDAVIEGKEGDQYTTEEASNVNEKYELVESATAGNTTGTIEKYNEAKPQEVIYYYRLKPAKVIIHYVEKDDDSNDSNNQVLSADEQINGYVDDSYNTNTDYRKETISKDGKTYTLVSDSGNTQGNMTLQDTNVTYYYLKNTKATVRYVERDPETGNIVKDLETPTTKEGLVGDEFVTYPKSFDKYRLAESPAQTTIKMAKEEQTLIYYYELIRTGLIENHIDEKTGRIIYTEQYNLPIGQSYSIPSRTFTGYDLVKNKLPSNASGTMGEDVVTVNYYYIKKAVLEVNYIDRATGNPLTDKVVDGTKHEGDSYTTEQKSFAEYDLVEAPTNASGTMQVETDSQGNITNNKTVVTYYYAKKSAGVEEHHIDIATGEELEEPTLHEGHVGDSYDIKAKNFLSYVVATTDKDGNNVLPENAKGTMKEKEKIIVNYYYYQPAKVIVHYVDKDTGKEIEETNPETGELQNSQVVIEGAKDEPYETTAKEFKYYVLSESPKEPNGLMKVEITKDESGKDIVNNTIELYYYYEAKPFNIGVEHKITGIIVNGVKREPTNGNLEKLDIYRKSTENTSVQIEYKVKVINSSEVDGTAIIEDKLPEGMTLANNDGTWEVRDTASPAVGSDDRAGNGGAGNSGNSGTVLRKVIPEVAAGETKEYTVLLNWNTSGDNMGEKTNEVTLVEADSIPGFADSNDKDNTSKTTVIIGVETGEFPVGLLIALAVLVILESVTLRYAVVLTKRQKKTNTKVKKKAKKK